MTCTAASPRAQPAARSTAPDDDHPYRTGVWKPNLVEYDADELDVVEGAVPPERDSYNFLAAERRLCVDRGRVPRRSEAADAHFTGGGVQTKQPPQTAYFDLTPHATLLLQQS